MMVVFRGLRAPVGEVVEGGRDRAAVVAVINVEDEPEILFVVRRISGRDPWSGQVALPGGRWEPGDRDLLETAERELMEEVGIRLGELRLLGALDVVRPSNMPSLTVTPFIAEAEGRPRVRLGGELSTYFWARLRELKPAEKIVRRPSGEYVVRPAYSYSAWVIWGVTARILDQIFERVGGPGSRLF